MSLTWTREVSGHRAGGDWSDGEYIAERGGDGMWRLFDDGRHDGNYPTLAAAQKRAAEIEAEWQEAHQ